MKKLGFFLAVFTIFIWGITFVSTKHLLQNFSPLEILFVRFILAYAGLWIMRPRALVLESRRGNIWFFLAGLTGITGYQFAENAAIAFTTASNVSIIVSICPLFAALFSQIFLKEKHVTVCFVVGFVTAIAGISLVSFNGNSEFHISPKGDFLALCSAVCWGFYSIFVSKINAMKLDKILCTRRMFFYALVCMVPLVVWGMTVGKNLSMVRMEFSPTVNAERFSDLSVWANFCFLGLGASAFCFVAWNVACNILGTVRITAGIYLIPVVTIVFAFIFLGEKLTFMGGIGCAVTIAGLIISNWRKK